MKLSRESRYALIAMGHLARRPAGTIMDSPHVAEETKLPAAFLAKTFRKLAHHGVLVSYRGGIRGYALARPSAEITVAEILTAVEGSDLFERCIFWRGECSEANPCPLHETWKVIRPEVTEAMNKLTLAELLVGGQLPDELPALQPGPAASA